MSAVSEVPPVPEIVAAGLKAAEGGFELSDRLPLFLREIQRRIGPGLLHASVSVDETGARVSLSEIGLTLDVAPTMPGAGCFDFATDDGAACITVVIDTTCPHPEGAKLAGSMAEALGPLIEQHYGDPLGKLSDLLGQAEDRVSRMATACAHLFSIYKKYTWVGFYMLGDEPGVLKVGPYAGFPTCTARIPVDKGMCGKSFSDRSVVNVPDTSQAKGYIACHTSTRSELVLPVIVDGETLGVFDLDSDIPAGFTAEDESLLASALELIFKIG